MGVIHLTHRHGYKPSESSMLSFTLNSTRGGILTFCNLTSQTFTTLCASTCSNAGFVKNQAAKGWIITLLFYLLNQWNRRNTGLHPQAVGLPQDALADCSRILSNYYLQRYDKFAENVCAKAGALYFRYADDQMILLNNPRQSGQSIAPSHTAPRPLWLKGESKRRSIFGRLPGYSSTVAARFRLLFAKKGDNHNSVLVKKFVDAVLAIPTSDLENTWKSRPAAP